MRYEKGKNSGQLFNQGFAVSQPAIVHTAGQIVHFVAHDFQSSHGLGSSLAGVAVEDQSFVLWQFAEVFMHIFAVWNIDRTLDVIFCVVSSGANVNELVSRIADEFFSVSNGDVAFFVGLFFSNFFVVAFDCCFDISIYSVGTCFERISAGGRLIFVAVNFGDTVVPAAGNVFRLFACRFSSIMV